MIRMAVVAIIIAILLSACGGGSSGPTAPPPPQAAGWTFQYSPGMSAPAPDGLGGVYFDFPPQDGVHYLVLGRSSPMSGAIAMDYEVTISMGATLTGPADPNNNCAPTPHFSLYFQRAGDNVTDPAKQSYRWFSKMVDILPGRSTLSVPLVSTLWTNVFGRQDAVGFATAAYSPQAVGMTFGHGCFAGHGLFVTGGSARFHIRSFAVQ